MVEEHGAEVDPGGGSGAESAPAVPQPERREGDEARVRLHQMADRLRRGRERLLLAEYLRLRRGLM